jgi:hypothetical protein
LLWEISGRRDIHRRGILGNGEGGGSDEEKKRNKWTERLKTSGIFCFNVDQIYGACWEILS